VNLPEERPYRIPDFAADAEVFARYEATARTRIAAVTARATQGVLDDHRQREAELRRIAHEADADFRAADTEAFAARTRYARLVPKQRTASGIARPPTFFFDLILSVGAANAAYEKTVATAKQRDDAAARSRVAAEAYEAFRGTSEAAIVKRELELRRHFKTDEGKADLDAHPDLIELARQCAEIDAERAVYRQRRDRGEVGDEEQRDRTMAEEGYRFLDGELRNVSCMRDRLIRFGALAYLVFRDREERLWLLDADEDLQPLAFVRFDIRLDHGRYLISRAMPSAPVSVETIDRRHRGPDTRIGRGVDPMLLRALRDFLEREGVQL
jgi:hypothetical protein